jgi:hypothetical protein
MSDVLEDAARVIHGPRRQAYGPVEESFDGIATVLNVVLRKKLVVELDGQDVALMMMSMKLCREANEHSWDNLVDLAGYAALKGQLAERVSVKSPEREAAAREILKDASEAQTEFEDEIKALLEDAADAKKQVEPVIKDWINVMAPGFWGPDLGGVTASDDSGVAPARGEEL